MCFAKPYPFWTTKQSSWRMCFKYCDMQIVILFLSKSQKMNFTQQKKSVYNPKLL